MKRWIPKLKKVLPKELLHIYDLSNMSKHYESACQGLMYIQEYFGLDLLHFTKGQITSNEYNRTFVAASELDSLDMFNIANEARKVYNYDGAVKWLSIAQKIAKEEGRTMSYLSKIR